MHTFLWHYGIYFLMQRIKYTSSDRKEQNFRELCQAICFIIYYLNCRNKVWTVSNSFKHVITTQVWRQRSNCEAHELVMKFKNWNLHCQCSVLRLHNSKCLTLILRFSNCTTQILRTPQKIICIASAMHAAYTFFHTLTVNPSHTQKSSKKIPP